MNEKKLQFITLMSGTRIDTNEQIGSVIQYWNTIEYNDMPKEIQCQRWWELSGSNLQILIKKDGQTKIKTYNDNTKILENVKLPKELLTKLFARISADDDSTYWVFINRKDLWQELVEYFGSEEKIWAHYIRWGH